MTPDDLISAYGASTQLCELPDDHVDDSSSPLGIWFRQLGYDESPRRVINQGYGWSVTIEEISRGEYIS